MHVLVYVVYEGVLLFLFYFCKGFAFFHLAYVSVVNLFVLEENTTYLFRFIIPPETTCLI